MVTTDTKFFQPYVGCPETHEVAWCSRFLYQDSGEAMSIARERFNEMVVGSGFQPSIHEFSLNQQAQRTI